MIGMKPLPKVNWRPQNLGTAIWVQYGPVNEMVRVTMNGMNNAHALVKTWGSIANLLPAGPLGKLGTPGVCGIVIAEGPTTTPFGNVGGIWYQAPYSVTH